MKNQQQIIQKIIQRSPASVIIKRSPAICIRIRFIERSPANSIIERPTAKSKFKYEHFQRKTATQRMNISSGRPLHDVTRRTTTRGWWLVLDRQRALDKELALPVTVLAQALASSELINSLAMGSSYDMQPAMHSISVGTNRFCTRL